MTKADWHDLTEDVFRDVFKNSAVKRTGWLGLQRKHVVSLGRLKDVGQPFTDCTVANVVRIS